jgi:hypothetical protein
MSCHIGPNIELKQEAIGGQPSRSFEEANLSFEQGKHRCIILLYVSPQYLLYVMIVHLRVGVGWKLVALGLFPYKNTLFTLVMD